MGEDMRDRVWNPDCGVQTKSHLLNMLSLCISSSFLPRTVTHVRITTSPLAAVPRSPPRWAVLTPGAHFHPASRPTVSASPSPSWSVPHGDK